VISYNMRACLHCKKPLFFRLSSSHETIPLETSLHYVPDPGAWVVVDTEFARPAEHGVDVGVAIYMDHRITCPVRGSRAQNAHRPSHARDRGGSV
jgi:hypothetical protein